MTPTRCIRAAASAAAGPCDVIVVDNDSTDSTASLAGGAGATVVHEAVHNIAVVRNAGARAAAGDILIFVDADTLVPQALFARIEEVMQDPDCAGGAVAVEYGGIERKWMQVYLAGWKFWAALFGMAQGAAQFCRRSVFERLGGYDSGIFMGEDIEFYWRLSRYARQQGGYVTLLRKPSVVSSARRFNQMKIGKVLLLTHPAFIRLTWRKKSLWRDWYESPIR
jgi:glycosyltransferase involved in cell wall biosynthesis